MFVITVISTLESELDSNLDLTLNLRMFGLVLFKSLPKVVLSFFYPCFFLSASRPAALIYEMFL